MRLEDSVTVGEALAEARDAAGLSVIEVSERARIREIVIRSMERDDFDALGGDLYVRGYLRAIAGVVGLDPKPLIREFDAIRTNGSAEWPAATEAAEVSPVAEPAVMPAPESPAPSQSAEPEPEATADETAPDTAGPGEPEDASRGEGDEAEHKDEHVTTAAGDAGADSGGPESWNAFTWQSVGDAYVSSWGDDAVADVDPAPDWWDAPVAQVAPTAVEPMPLLFDPEATVVDQAPLAAAEMGAPVGGPPVPPWVAPETPGRPPGQSGSGPRTRNRGWRRGAAISALAVVVLAIVGGVIVAKLRSPGHASAAASPTATGGSRPATSPAALATTAPAPSQAVTPTLKPRPRPRPRPPAPVQRLPVGYAEAFGPDGVADGDNPSTAVDAITPQAGRPWHTDWYTTATFGMLKDGTGLLLDMGRRVTVSSVSVQLGSAWGADLQLRAGNEAAFSVMPAVASRDDTGGLVTLRLKAPVRARYVLVWFVRLPPTGTGKYQASIYSVEVAGRP